MTTELQQTKGKIRVEGKVVGFDPNNENTYREGFTKNDNKPYRSVSLGVKTSPTNIVYNLDLFGMEPKKKVKIFSNKNGEKKNMEIDFEDRNNMPAGFTCFGFGTVATGFESDGTKTKMTNYFNLDGVEVIKDNLGNDASVWIDGEFNVNSYISNGEEKQTVKYNINRIGLLKTEIDFEQENFKEVASFEQEMVIVGHILDKENKKLLTTGRIINFDKTWNDVTFVIDLDKFEKLGQNIYKKTKFGDVITVQGKIVNGVILTEVEEVQEFNWGGETPEGQGQRVIKNRVSEFQITNVKEHKAKVYKEEDFIKVADFTTDDPFTRAASKVSVDETPFEKDGQDFQW